MNVNVAILNNFLSSSVGRVLFRLGLPFALLAIFVWSALYWTGALPWLGYKNKHDSWAGIGGTSQGMTLGTSRFLFFKGQTVFIDYDIDEINSGALWINVGRKFSPRSGEGRAHQVTSAGSGRFAHKITSTGLYFVRVEGRMGTKGKGYDVAYSAKWGAYFGDGVVKTAHHSSAITAEKTTPAKGNQPTAVAAKPGFDEVEATKVKLDLGGLRPSLSDG